MNESKKAKYPKETKKRKTKTYSKLKNNKKKINKNKNVNLNHLYMIKQIINQIKILKKTLQIALIYKGNKKLTNE